MLVKTSVVHTEKYYKQTLRRSTFTQHPPHGVGWWGYTRSPPCWWSRCNSWTQTSAPKCAFCWMESRGCNLCGRPVFHLWAAGRVHGTSHSSPWHRDRWKARTASPRTREAFQWRLKDSTGRSRSPALRFSTLSLIPTFLAFYWS